MLFFNLFMNDAQFIQSIESVLTSASLEGLQQSQNSIFEIIPLTICILNFITNLTLNNFLASCAYFYITVTECYIF